MKDLEEYIEKSNSGNIKEALASLLEALKQKDEDTLQSFIKTQEVIASHLGEMIDKLDKIISRPDPKFPEFPKPIEPKEPSMAWVPNITNAIRYDGDQTRKVLEQILESLNEEDQEEKNEVTQPVKTVNTAAVRSRRTTQWKRFDNYDLKNITAGGDGVTFYLPDSLIKDSESVLLNGGSPLKNSDYTLTGNKIVFNNGDQSGSQIEVRGQVK